MNKQHTNTMRTINEILSSGFIKVCVSNNIRGFSSIDGEGNRRGFDIDLATAIAHAMFDDGSEIQFTEVYPDDRLNSINTGTADIGLFNLSASLSRIQAANILTQQPYLYDTEAALISADRETQSLRELNNPLIATQSGTTTGVNLERYLPPGSYSVVEFKSHEDALNAYLSRRVDAYVLDSLSLHMAKDKFQFPEADLVTRETISIESMIPAIRSENIETSLIYFTVLQTLLTADMYGITSRSYCSQPATKNIELFNQKELKYGNTLLLRKGYFGRIIDAVGNYTEIYERNFRLSDNSVIPKNFNTIFNLGGLHVPTPIL